jgi:hypothetical protein
MEFEKPSEGGLWRSVLTGMLAGAAATRVMTMYQVNSKKLMKRVQSDSSQRQQSVQQQNQRKIGALRFLTITLLDSDPTVTVANRVSRSLRGREIRGEHRELAGNIVHYVFGTLNGGLFGLLRVHPSRYAAARACLRLRALGRVL